MWIRTSDSLEKIESLKVNLYNENSLWAVFAFTAKNNYIIFRGTEKACNQYIDNIIERLNYNEKRIIIYY